MQVKDIMSTDITTIERNDDLRRVEELMTTKKLRHLPVVEDGDLVGIVSQRDLFKESMPAVMGYGEKARQGFFQSVRVKEVMVYPVITTTPTTSLQEAIEVFLQKGIGCLPVVEAGKLVGMVTKTDLLRHLSTLSAQA